MSTAPVPEPRTTAGLLAEVRDEVASRRASEVREVRRIVAWAELNTVDAPEDAATICDGFVDTGVPIAGEGAPLVSEFALLELCAVLGRSTAGGREYVGKVLETSHRLPALWEAVTSGRVPVWRALRIADTTRLLSTEAAAYVDHHLAAFAATCTFAQVDRLVAEALARFDPQTAEEQRREAADGRRFEVHTDDAGIEGTVAVDGVLDIADGLDLDAAISQRAEELARLGSDEPRDVRRARAVGELARADQILEYGTGDRAGGFEARAADGLRTSTAETPPAPFRRPGRRVQLHVHLTDTALTGISTGSTTGEVGRLGDTRFTRPAESAPTRSLAVASQRNVSELAPTRQPHEPLEAYEIPERHKRQVRLRDPHCAFPHCNRRAERCDLDHAHPHRDGGATCACNLVPLCRGHHRAKTHSAWGYTVLDPGQYLWTSPTGHQYLVDHRGTHSIDVLPQRH